MSIMPFRSVNRSFGHSATAACGDSLPARISMLGRFEPHWGIKGIRALANDRLYPPLRIAPKALC